MMNMHMLRKSQYHREIMEDIDRLINGIEGIASKRP